MLSVSRINGSATKVGTLYDLNANLYLITVKIAGGTAIDLQTEDSYINATTQMADGVLEAIVKEINPLAYWSPADNSGKIHVVMDQAINDADELRTRIRRAVGYRVVTATTNSTTTLAYTSAIATMLGAVVTGPGIPAGTTVATVNVGTSLILSQAATTSVTGGSFTIGFDITGTTVTAASSLTVA